MSIKELHQKALIKNEPGIISKKGGGFHMPISFAEKHLFYIIWGDEYICSEKTETDLPVEEVAYQCGFSSATHFIRVFKQRTMITPAAFRKYFDPIGFR